MLHAQILDFEKGGGGCMHHQQLASSEGTKSLLGGRGLGALQENLNCRCSYMGFPSIWEGRSPYLVAHFPKKIVSHQKRGFPLSVEPTTVLSESGFMFNVRQSSGWWWGTATKSFSLHNVICLESTSGRTSCHSHHREVFLSFSAILLCCLSFISTDDVSCFVYVSIIFSKHFQWKGLYVVVSKSILGCIWET